MGSPLHTAVLRLISPRYSSLSRSHKDGTALKCVTSPNNIVALIPPGSKSCGTIDDAPCSSGQSVSVTESTKPTRVCRHPQV